MLDQAYIIKTLGVHSPQVKRDIETFSDLSISSYFEYLYRPVKDAQCLVQETTRELLKQFAPETKHALDTSAHLEPLISSNYWQAVVGSCLGQPYKSSFNCFFTSSVSYESKSKSGPAWVHYLDKKFLIFQDSRMSLRSRQPISDRKNRRLNFSFLNSSRKTDAFILRASEDLKQGMAKEIYPQLNSKIIFNWSGGSRDLKCIDAELVLKIFNNSCRSNGLLSKIILNPLKLKKLESLFSYERQMNPFINILAPKSISPFLLVRDEKIIPLFLEGTHLSDKSQSGSPDATLPLDRIAIAEAIEQQKLIPSTFTMIATMFLASGLRALGGQAQAIYLPCFAKIFASILDDTDSEEKNWKISLKDNLEYGWSQGALAAMPTPIDFFNDQINDLTTLTSWAKETKLKDASANLKAFRQSKGWQTAAQLVAPGTILKNSETLKVNHAASM